MNPLGSLHYSVQTASEVNSILTFEISDLNYIIIIATIPQTE